ncbi:MAG: hypothetical protein MZU97_16220 [Bacillus subtilis]|nr:hypothetical protein [Bacillus subtilis]
MAKDNLKEERMKILELLTKGLITPADAEKLLTALSNQTSENDESPIQVVAAKKAPFRMLRIYVDSHDGDKVRIQVPIEFAKLLKTGKFNIDAIEDFDIDIDMLLQMINSGVIGELVNVESADGDTVKIVVE